MADALNLKTIAPAIGNFAKSEYTLVNPENLHSVSAVKAYTLPSRKPVEPKQWNVFRAVM